jgi:DNA polymerase
MKSLTNKINNCTACNLVKFAAHKVHFRGSLTARILFIGEAPGRQEDEEGLPFVGSAGKILDSLLSKYNLSKDSYAITNCVCCRPPGNRVPTKEEISACKPNLEQTIKYIKPRIIVTLGLTATQVIFEMYNISSEPSMQALHGNITYASGGMIFVPTYHPAATLYNKALLDDLDKDFEIISRLHRGF